jgi:hypothetical protein
MVVGGAAMLAECTVRRSAVYQSGRASSMRNTPYTVPFPSVPPRWFVDANCVRARDLSQPRLILVNADRGCSREALARVETRSALRVNVEDSTDSKLVGPCQSRGTDDR